MTLLAPVWRIRIGGGTADIAILVEIARVA
jgi:hypothetical protein